MLLRRPPLRARPAAGPPGLELALRGLAVAGPEVDFQLRLRCRLLAVSAVESATVAARPPALRRSAGWLPRAVAAGAAGAVGIAGIGVATSRALPGQPLYGAKRQIESWQLAAASGNAARGREQLSFARTRMAEVEALAQHQDLTAAAAGTTAQGSSAERIAGTLRRMDSETRAGTTDLADAARSGDGQAGRELLTFADDQSARLTAVAPRLPSQANAAVETSRSVLQRVTALAHTLPGTPQPSVTDPARERTAEPSVSRVHPDARPTGAPASPTLSAPSTAVARSPGDPRPLPTRTAMPSSPPAPTAPPAGPPSRALPTSLRGLLSGQQTDGS